LGSTTQPMQVRAQPSPPDYPVLVCEATIPTGVTSASVAGQTLPLPKPSPNRIVVIGDAGCRVGKAQACNDPQAWPFEQVANSAAAFSRPCDPTSATLLYREERMSHRKCRVRRQPVWLQLCRDERGFFTPAAAAACSAVELFYARKS
jgi:hypothetical protein